MQPTKSEKIALLKRKLEALGKQRQFNYRQSSSQKAIYLAYLTDPRSSSYNVAFAATIYSNPDIEVFTRAIESLTKRHAALRTTYSLTDGEPFQCIHDTIDVTIEEVDAGTWSDDELKRNVKDNYHRPFDLEKGPVFRVTFFRCGPDRCVLLFVIHHISCDAWSLMLLMEEMGKYYKEGIDNKAPALEPIGMEYLDYIKSQDLMLAAEGKKFRDYWTQKLSGSADGIRMPFDKPRPPVQTFKGASIQFRISSEQYQQLKALAKAQSVTLFILLLGVFKVLLQKYSGQSDIVVGTTDAGRNKPEWYGIVGHFVNLIPIRSQLPEQLTFPEFITRLKESVLQDFSHKNYPFSLLVNDLKIKRDPSRSPLVQVVFSMLRTQHGNELQLLQQPGNERMRIQWNGLDLGHFPLTQQEGQFDLTLNLVEGEEDISGTIKFNTDLFEASTVKDLVDRYMNLLRQVVTKPSDKIGSYTLMSEAERMQELTTWNPPVFNASTACLHTKFEEQVVRFPFHAAVHFGDESIQYHELNRRANQLAHYLLKFGTGPEIPIGIFLDRSIEMLVSVLAILKAGGVFVPLDPLLPTERIRYIAGNAGIRAIITLEQHKSVLPDKACELICLDLDSAVIKNQPEENLTLSLPVVPPHLAYILYTSGSTGLPKGVAVEHRQVVYYLEAVLPALDLCEQCSFASASTISADAIYTQIFGALCTGGVMHVLDKDLVLDPPRLIKYFSDHPIDCLKVTPSYLDALLSSGIESKVLPVKCLMVGGEAFDCALLEKIKLLKPSCAVVNHYGPTETTIGVSTYEIRSFDCKYGVRSVPIGYPLPHSQLFLLDHLLNPVPPGLHGEIYIGGHGLARGYLGSARLTAEKFIPHPYADNPGERLYKTGDLGRRLPDGAIEYLGRIDKQLKIRGYRVDPGELESALSSYTRIDRAIAHTVKNRRQENELIVYVVLKKNEPFDQREIREHIKAHLPDYFMPAAIVQLDKIPLNIIGKVDYNLLPPPTEDNFKKDNEYYSPRNDKEQILVAIWEKVLKVDRVGIFDNFFLLGGDSISSIKLIAEARNAGIFITPRQVFEKQTIAAISQVAETRGTVATGRDAAEGFVPLIPVQQWFFQQYGESPHFYNQSIIIETGRRLSSILVKDVFALLIEHHEALRIRFRQKNESWEQFYIPEHHFDLLEEQVDGLSDQQLEERTGQVAQSFHTGLDITNGPVIKACLFTGGEKQSSRLLIVIHHLVVDAFSWRILLEDLFALYTQLEQGQAAVLPPKSDSFKTWAERLNNYANSDQVHKELDYWMAQTGNPSLISSDDRSKENGVHSFSGEKSMEIILEPALTKALLENSFRVYNMNLSEMLIASLAITFKESTHTSAILLLLEGHGREDIFEDVDHSRTVGWFTSKYPILITLPQERGFEPAISAVKEQLRRIPGKGIGYGLLRYLSGNENIQEQMKKIPEPEIVFNFLGKIESAIEHGPWRVKSKAIDSRRDPGLIPNHLIEIIGMQINDELRFQWNFNAGFTGSYIERLSKRFKEVLVQLTEHCSTTEKKSISPADFPGISLDQDQLNKLLSQIT